MNIEASEVSKAKDVCVVPCGVNFPINIELSLVMSSGFKRPKHGFFLFTQVMEMCKF